MSQVVMVFMTADNDANAAKIGRAAVEKRAAACCNIIPAVRSVYRWRGEIHDDPETMCVFKTTADKFGELKELIVSMHPYECPEIIMIPVADGHAPYLDWVAESV